MSDVKKARMIYRSRDGQYPLFAAIRACGGWEQVGIDPGPEITFVSGTYDSENMLMDDKIDLIFGSHVTPYLRYDEGKPFVYLGQVMNFSQDVLITKLPVKSLSELKGKRFGYSSLGALGHYSLMLFFRKMGWDSVHDVSMLSGGGDPSSITNGYVDAMAATDVTLDEARKIGLRDLVDLSQYHFVMPGSGVNALSDWLPKNRDAAARFVKATVEAIALVKTDKQAALASITKWFGITDPAKLESVYADAMLLPSKPYPSIEGLKAMQSVYNWREMEIRTPEDFSDSSFVAELDKSGFIDGLYKNKTAPR